MKSNFGQRKETFFSEGFKRDLGSLLRLSLGARAKVAQLSVKALFVKTTREKDMLVDQLITSFPDERTSWVGPVDIAKYFANIFASDPTEEPAASDEPAAIAADLESIPGVLPPDLDCATQALTEVLAQIKQEAHNAQEEMRRREYAAGVLPKLRSIATTIELRAVFDSKFRIGGEVEQYRPHVVDSVPVVTIRMRLTDCDHETVAFQSSEDELAFLIDALRACQVELKAIKEKGALL